MVFGFRTVAFGSLIPATHYEVLFVSPASHSLSRWPVRFFWFVFLFVLGVVSLPAQSNNIAGSTTTNSATPISVTGQAINAITGQPISRVLIRINDRAVLTTHEGKFEFDQYTGTGNATLQATKPGYYLSADPIDRSGISFTADQLTDPIEVRLYPEALLTGTVTTAEGEAIPHLPVTARLVFFDGFSRRSSQNAQSQTDSHGNFRMAVPPGDYKIETRYVPRSMQSSEAILPLILPEHSASNASDIIHISSGQQLHFDLHPRNSRTYEVGISIDEMPERAYPMIVARSSDGSAISVPVNQSGPFGEFRTQLPTGTYAIDATVAGPESFAGYAHAIITVPDHDITGVVLHMVSITGIPVELQVDQSTSSGSSTMSDNATPPNLQQLGLALISMDSAPDRENIIVGVMPTRNQTFNFVAAPGTYHLQARNHGQWYVKAANYGTSDLLQQDIVVGPSSSGTPIRITVGNQTSTLQGTLRLNGKPASCWLYLIPTTPSADPLMTIHSNSSGTYNEAYLPLGGYQAIAFERRYSGDLRDPQILARFSTYVHTITANAGDKPTLDLDAVPVTEMLP